MLMFKVYIYSYIEPVLFYECGMVTRTFW